MVKRRSENIQNANKTIHDGPTPEAIEAFASQADDISVVEKKKQLDPNAKRDYKQIRVPLNEYEYEQLVKGSEATRRSKLSFIRWAMIEMAK